MIYESVADEPTAWRRKFAYFPTEVGKKNGRIIKVWWQYYEERWVSASGSLHENIERRLSPTCKPHKLVVRNGYDG